MTEPKDKKACKSFGPADEMMLTREERERLACILDMETINNTAEKLQHPQMPKADAAGNIDVAKYFGGFMAMLKSSEFSDEKKEDYGDNQ
jgi:hypothetical protein